MKKFKEGDKVTMLSFDEIKSLHNIDSDYWCIDENTVIGIPSSFFNRNAGKEFEIFYAEVNEKASRTGYGLKNGGGFVFPCCVFKNSMIILLN